MASLVKLFEVSLQLTEVGQMPRRKFVRSVILILVLVPCNTLSYRHHKSEIIPKLGKLIA